MSAGCAGHGRSCAADLPAALHFLPARLPALFPVRFCGFRWPAHLRPEWRAAHCFQRHPAVFQTGRSQPLQTRRLRSEVQDKVPLRPGSYPCLRRNAFCWQTSNLLHHVLPVQKRCFAPFPRQPQKTVLNQDLRFVPGRRSGSGSAVLSAGTLSERGFLPRFLLSVKADLYQTVFLYGTLPAQTFLHDLSAALSGRR